MRESAGWDPPIGRGILRPLIPLAQAISKQDQRRLGQRVTGRMAVATNLHRRRCVAFRRRVYEDCFEELLEANGGVANRIEMKDGFAIDTSRSLPHLEPLLAAGEQMIAEYGGVEHYMDKPFLQDISPKDAIVDHPVLLDFVTSSEVIAAAAPTFGFVPALPGTIPHGVRLMESSTKFDPQAEGPWRESQLAHCDYHSLPTVYVIVAIRDIGPDDGPLHFLGKAATRRVVEALGYGSRGTPYRLLDETLFSLVDPGEMTRFVAPAGTVLFIESSACMHFGSRNPQNNRYQFQYSLTSPLRRDLYEVWREQRRFPISCEDSDLRRLVLDRKLLGLQ